MGLEFAFCRPSDWAGWSVCPGKPTLEEGEGSPPTERPRKSYAQWLRDPNADLSKLPHGTKKFSDYIQEIRDRVSSYQKAGAKVSVLPDQKLDLSLVTGEKGANVICDCVLIAEFEDHSVLDVCSAEETHESALEIYAIAAYLQHSVLHNFTQVNLLRYDSGLVETHRKVEDLYVFGAEVTAAAALSLSLRSDVTALSHLVVGDQCGTCRARERCPEIAKSVM